MIAQKATFNRTLANSKIYLTDSATFGDSIAGWFSLSQR
jgi:hypothetical protein